MKKIILALFLAIPHVLFAQNYNPFVAQGIVSPAPLEDVASGGTGIVSFLVGNTGDDALPLVVNQEMLLVITLSRGEPNNADPIAAIGGDFASYFDWQYDASTLSYLGTQNKLIPDALNGGVGSIEIVYKVTSNSVESSPQNGFNVNLTPPAYTNGIQSLNDDQVSSYTWTVPASSTVQDFNATFVNVPVTGHVNTNDKVPTGTTYGTASPVATNPSTSTINMLPNGSYTFSGPVPGVYKFEVPVCPIGQSTNCPTELLTITVIDASINTNPPTANIDQGTTIGQTPITLNTLGNDACNNLNCDLAPGSVSILTPPLHGTVTVDPITGNTTYIANPSFYGVDTLTYEVCDSTTTPVKCVTSLQIIEVIPPGGKNLIDPIDDYKVTPLNTTATGNVAGNDNDPEGDNITIIKQNNVVITGKGTITIDSLGNYSFIPLTDYSGSVEVPYEACDNGTPQACSKATLYITILPQSIPFPVVLNDFNLSVNNCSVILNWSTVFESKTSHFDIMRKAENENTYIVIGKVVAKGNSNTITHYDYTDAMVKDNTYTYLLNMVDLDGQYVKTETQTVKIACDELNEISLYPNPTSENTYIMIKSFSNDIFDIKVVNMVGQSVYSTSVEVNYESKIIPIPSQQWANGIYNIIVTTETEDNILRFEKRD